MPNPVQRCQFKNSHPFYYNDDPILINLHLSSDKAVLYQAERSNYLPTPKLSNTDFTNSVSEAIGVACNELYTLSHNKGKR